MSPPSGCTSRRLLYGVGFGRSLDDIPLVLDGGGVLYVSPLEVGTALGLEFARHSSGAFYSPNFRALRPLSFVDVGEVPESYNVPFKMPELHSTFARCSDGTAGPDGFSYPFLRRHHSTAMQFLISF